MHAIHGIMKDREGGREGGEAVGFEVREVLSAGGCRGRAEGEVAEKEHPPVGKQVKKRDEA